MSVADRKYLSEFAVNLYTARWLIITPSDLAVASDREIDHAALEIANQCHIYLICRRPASSIDPSDFLFNGGLVTGSLIHKINGVTNKSRFSLPFVLSDGAIDVQLAPYPHKEFYAINSAGEPVRFVPVTMLSMCVSNLRDLEVLYVGQAFGDGTRTAFDRLKSHATLQKILAESYHKNPDDEILLCAFEYLPYRLITTFDGIDKRAIRDERDDVRLKSIIENPLSRFQQICLAEAGLIRYFQPHYNEVYKGSFPASDQKILSECYGLDFSGLIVEIDTTELGVSLFSRNAPSSDHHTAKFDLFEPTTRRSFFTFVTEEGRAVEMPKIIPPSR